jgi:hypothetical protein
MLLRKTVILTFGDFVVLGEWKNNIIDLMLFIVVIY